jgi:hypothetical protein
MAARSATEEPGLPAVPLLDGPFDGGPNGGTFDPGKVPIGLVPCQELAPTIRTTLSAIWGRKTNPAAVDRVERSKGAHPDRKGSEE